MPISKYELTRLLAHRMQELQKNSPPRVPFEATDTLFDIALREMIAGLVNARIIRHSPGDTLAIEEVNDVKIQDFQRRFYH